MAKMTLEVESFPYFDKEGVGISTFIGEDTDPLEDYYSFKDMIDHEMEGWLIRDIAFAIDFSGLDHCRAVARQLREAADYFDQRINNSYVFDRDMWWASGSESERFMDFCTKISELDDSENQLKLDL